MWATAWERVLGKFQELQVFSNLRVETCTLPLPHVFYTLIEMRI